MLWQEQYFANISGASPEAQELAQLLKRNYKDNLYIPWATIERLAYSQDADFELTKIENEEGGYVFTDTLVIETENDGKHTLNRVFSHMVKCKCTFLGKVFEESYPIQDNAYNAVRVYDQNLVNKSLQRCATRLIARATGLGISLYETGDLNYDTTSEEPIVPKAMVEPTEQKPKAKAINVCTDDPTEPVGLEADDTVEKIIELIHSTDEVKLTKAVKSLNMALIKQFGFSIKYDDDDDKLRTNLSKLNEREKFLGALKHNIDNAK